MSSWVALLAASNVLLVIGILFVDTLGGEWYIKYGILGLALLLAFAAVIKAQGG